MKNPLLLLAAGLLLALSHTCPANDTVGAELDGGITFEKTDSISMEKEVLTLSRAKIRVEYEFLNLTSKPVQKRIYFPMPLDQDDFCDEQYHGDLEGFKLWVDGAPVKTMRTVRAVLPGGRDVTQTLRNLGMKDDQILNFGSTSGSPPQCDIVEDPDGSTHDGMIQAKLDWKKLHAAGISEMWLSSNIYYWDQVFPPGKKIKVVHEYAPRIGTDSGAIGFGAPDGIQSARELSDRLHAGQAQWKLCIDNGTYRAAKKTALANDSSLRHAILGYVLTTGANWAGPIKDFTLNLKKNDPGDVVSLCFPGHFKRQSPLVLSAHLTNFVPRDDIVAVFLFP